MKPRQSQKKAAFDYSRLDPAFYGLAKPAQRALINHGILTIVALADRSRTDVAKLHGIGSTVLLKLDQILDAAGREFRS